MVFTPGFAELFRQNYAAEAMMQGLVGPDQARPLRAAIYRRIALEHQRRSARSLPLDWTVGPCFHPTEVSRQRAIRVRVHTYGATEHNRHAGQHEVTLEELHCPHLPLPSRWWELPQYGRDVRAGWALRQLGKRASEVPPYIPPPADKPFYPHFMGLLSQSGFYIQPLSGIIRPVWDIDLFGNRLCSYAKVSAGDLGRKEFTVEKLKQDRMWAITYYKNQIVGVAQFV
jgi:hypothetical protein